MVIATPKYPTIDPHTFRADPTGNTPWSHLQILGGRQLVAFDKEGAIVGTIDLALTSDIKIVRQADIVDHLQDGSRLHIRYKAPVAAVTPVVKSQADGYSDDDDDYDEYDDYGYSD